MNEQMIQKMLAEALAYSKQAAEHNRVARQAAKDALDASEAAAWRFEMVAQAMQANKESAAQAV